MTNNTAADSQIRCLPLGRPGERSDYYYYIPTYRGLSVEVVDCDAPSYANKLGGVWYIAECEATDSSRRGPRRWFKLSRTPFTTNMTREERTSGWLGCSFGVDEYARGQVRCTVRDDGTVGFRAVRD